MNSLVSIVIVNWNGLRWLPGCLSSLEKQDWKKIEVIVVDNASIDGSVAWVKKNYPNITILRNDTNVGYAQGNNIGYKASKGKYVLFLNNDTRVTKTFLSELINVFQRDMSIGGVQSKIFLMDDPQKLDCIGSFLTPTGFLYHYKYGKKDKKAYDKEIDLYTAKGASMMFRHNVLDKVTVEGNLFDPEYFAYFEESDLCHRVWLSGHRIVYAYKSVTYHKMGATSITMNNADIQFHSFKNRIRTYLKNFGLLDVFTILPFHIFLVEWYGLYALLKGRFNLWWALQRAIAWNIFHIGKTLTLRKIIQTRINTHDPHMKEIIFKYPPVRYYQALVTGLSMYNE